MTSGFAPRKTERNMLTRALALITRAEVTGRKMHWLSPYTRPLCQAWDDPGLTWIKPKRYFLPFS